MITSINEWQDSQLQSELDENGQLISKLSDIKLANKEIDMKALEQFARGLMMVCMGEYGDTFYNPTTFKIFICLGDASPFGNDEDLAWWIVSNVQFITPKYGSFDISDIEIEHEALPSTDEGWLKYDFESRKFVKYID